MFSQLNCDASELSVTASNWSVAVMQGKLAFLRTLKQGWYRYKVYHWDYNKFDDFPSSPNFVTIAEIKVALSCAQPVRADTAELLCTLLNDMAPHIEAQGSKMKLAGALPVLVQLLVQFPDNRDIMIPLCSTLSALAYASSGNLSGKSRSYWYETSAVFTEAYMRGLPGLIDGLKAAHPHFKEWGEDTEDFAPRQILRCIHANDAADLLASTDSESDT